MQGFGHLSAVAAVAAQNAASALQAGSGDIQAKVRIVSSILVSFVRFSLIDRQYFESSLIAKTFVLIDCQMPTILTVTVTMTRRYEKEDMTKN